MKKLIAIAGMAWGVTQGVQANIVTGNLLVNGDFETGDFTGWTEVGPLTTVRSGSYGGYTAYSGNDFVYFGAVGSDATLAQTVSDTAGSIYNLTFWLAGNGTLPSDLNVIWNGVTVATINPIANQPYTQYSYFLTGTGLDTLTFGLRNDPNYDALDAVSLTGAAAPDASSTLPLLGAGLLAVSALRRKLS